MKFNPKSEMQELNIKSLDQVRDEILNALLIAIAVFAILPLMASLYRAKEIGWQYVMVSQLIAYAVLSIAAIFRRKLQYVHKATVVITFGFVVGCIAITNMGLIGSGMLFMVFSVVLTTMFFSTRQALLLIIGSLGFLAFSAVSVSQKWLVFPFDIESAALSFPAWISKIFAFTLFSAILIFSLGRLINHLIDSSKTLKARSQELKIANEKLLKEVDEKKQAKEELEQSESKYRLLAENATDIIWTTDLDLNMTYISPSIEHVRGFTVEEAMQQKPEERMTQASLAIVSEILSEHLDQEKKSPGDPFNYRTIEIESLCKDGSTKWTETKVTFVRDSDGKANGLLGVSRDISGRKKLDKKIRLVQHWVEHSIDLFFWVQEDSQVLYVNQAVCSLLDYSHEEMCTLKVGDFDLEITHDAWAGFTQILREQGSYVFETRLRRKDGLLIPVEITANILKFEGRDHFFAYGKDISARIDAEIDRKKLESKLLQSQKLEAIGTLAGGIAHDFNNILAGIIGYTELALMDVVDLPSTKKMLDRVMEASGRAADLVKQILSFSGNQKGDPKPVSPMTITKEVLKLIRATLPSTIEIKPFLDSKSYVLADATNIHQVLMNLCTNAAYAMKQTGGVLTARLQNVTLEHRDVVLHKDVTPGAFVKISIEDTGSGMNEEVRNKVFDPFFTTKKPGEGTGMGLAAVHGIISELGGFVTLESELNQGTAIHAFIPAIPDPAKAKQTLDSQPPKGGTERILFIDDEEIQIEIAMEGLSPYGYQVTPFVDSSAAWKHFQQNPDAYDLVITDMTMPKMTGDVLAQKIRMIRPNVPIIMCTGFSEIMDENKAAAIGVKAFLYKPIILRKLLGTIREVLDQNNSS